MLLRPRCPLRRRQGVRSASRAAKRPFQILETLRAGFDIGQAGGGAWATELRWLYDLRDPAQHVNEADKPAVLHPTGTNTSEENVRYSLESADRAVDLLEVLTTCSRNPRPALAEWVERGVEPVVSDLIERRRQAR